MGAKLIFRRDNFRCQRCQRLFSEHPSSLSRHHMIPHNPQVLFPTALPPERKQRLLRLRKQHKFQITLCHDCHDEVHYFQEETYFYPNKCWQVKEMRPSLLPLQMVSPAQSPELETRPTLEEKAGLRPRLRDDLVLLASVLSQPAGRKL